MVSWKTVLFALLMSPEVAQSRHQSMSAHRSLSEAKRTWRELVGRVDPMLFARHGVPAIGSIREFVMAGGLMSYGASDSYAYRRAGAQYVARILKGAKLSDKTSRSGHAAAPPSVMMKSRR